RFGLRHGHTWFQARQCEPIPVIAIPAVIVRIDRDRKQNLHWGSRCRGLLRGKRTEHAAFRKLETVRQHTDNLVGSARDVKSPTNYLWIAVEETLPKRIGNDGNFVVTGDIVTCDEVAADKGLYLENV